MIGTIAQQVCGLFKIIHRNIDGSIKEIYDWQPNLVTNHGLEMIKRNGKVDFVDYIRIGSGTTNFTITDTDLYNEHISGFTTQYHNQIGVDGINEYGNIVETDWIFAYKRFNMRFNINTAMNISELGLSSNINYSVPTSFHNHPSNVQMSTLARIKDSVGNPTTISVIDGESLDIAYEFRRYMKREITDFGTLNCTIRGITTTYNVKGRPYGYASNNVGGVSSTFSFASYNTNFKCDLNEGILETNLNEIAINGSSYTNDIINPNSYTYIEAPLGEYKQTVSFKNSRRSHNNPLAYFSLMTFNHYSVHSYTIEIKDSNGDGIPVPTEDIISDITIEYTWGRYTGTLNPR